MKWLMILILILALPFALGLRIDFKALNEHLHKKPDPNAAVLQKMGLDPKEYGKKEKPWWTFNLKDNIFSHLKKWDPIQKMSDDSWRASQQLRKNLGPSPQELMDHALAEQGRIMKARQAMMAREAEAR